MTPEEAGEEILRGPFTSCWWCQGRGHNGEKNVLIPRLSPLHCRHCQGHGKYLRRDYVSACIELGIKPAELPSTVLSDPFVSDYADNLKKVFGTSWEDPFKKEYLGDWLTAKNEEDAMDGFAYATEYARSVRENQVMKLPDTRNFKPRKRLKL